MQLAGDPEAEIADLAFRIRGLEIADMAHPGGSFHFIARRTSRHHKTCFVFKKIIMAKDSPKSKAAS